MFISPAYAQAAAPAGSTGALFAQFVPLILLFIIFWFLIFRPQQKRAKDHRDMVAAVKRGDTVVTSGGIVGKVTRVEDAEVDVEIAKGVVVKVVKATLSDVRGLRAPVAANDAKA